MTLLDIQNLKTYYETRSGMVHAVDDVTLSIDKNETVGIVGESGSGKTTLAKSIIRVLPDNAEIVAGSISLAGQDLTLASERDLRRIRWNEISMIPQSAMNALDPVYTIGDQIIEVIRTHEDVSRTTARSRAEAMFDLVELDAARLDDYPHQFSGGMKQRAMIAMSLVLEPSVILADEPTTALDVIVQDQTLRRIKEIQETLDTAMILITHDISVVSEICDKIAVLYGGKVVEFGDTETIIDNSHHPYTLGLRNAFPRLVSDHELVSIPGQPPNLTDPADECRFADRCPFAIDECYERSPSPREIQTGHVVECHRAEEAAMLQTEANKRSTWLENDD